MDTSHQFQSSTHGAFPLPIEILEVEMSRQTGAVSCGSCADARDLLAEAVELATPVLASIGVQPHIVRRVVTTEKEARINRVAASPTIRVGTEEIRPIHRDKSEAGRVWAWEGEDYPEPPLSMLVDLLLRGYVALRPAQSLAATELAPYLGQFLTSERRSSETSTACSG